MIETGRWIDRNNVVLQMANQATIEATKALLAYDGIPPQLVEAVKVDLLAQFDDFFEISEQVATLAISMTCHTWAGNVPTDYHMLHVSLWQNLYSKCMDEVNHHLALGPVSAEQHVMEAFRNAVYDTVAKLSQGDDYKKQMEKIADAVRAKAHAGGRQHGKGSPLAGE